MEKCFGEANLGKRLYRNLNGIEDEELEEWWKNVEPKLIGERAREVDWYYNALYKNSIIEGTWNYSLASKIVLSVVEDFVNNNGLRKLGDNFLWESDAVRLMISFCPFCIVVSIFKLKDKDCSHNFCFGVRSYENVGEIESEMKTWAESTFGGFIVYYFA